MRKKGRVGVFWGARKRTFRFAEKNASFQKGRTFRFADYIFETEMMIAGSDMNPEPPNPGYNSGHNPDDFWDAWR